MAYTIKQPKEKKDGVIEKLKLKVFGFDNKWHNVYYDGYGHFFHYENNNKKRIWDA